MLKSPLPTHLYVWMLEIDLCSFLSWLAGGGAGRPELLGELGPDLVKFGVFRLVVEVEVEEEVGSGNRPTGLLCPLIKYIQFIQCMQSPIFCSFTQILIIFCPKT